VGYLEMLDLVEHAFAVVTDSGGLQEETTALGVPCLTIRPNTERPITISEGTNRLVPDPADIVKELSRVLRPVSPPCPEGWDGHAGERVIASLSKHL
jgi:UDP-N-acetylglucosamine 2-epimerase (non-hydrolysing)